jgi:hypothetical protein
MRLKHAGGQTLPFAQQPEQDVLGPDVVVPEAAGLLLGPDNDLASLLGESLKHASKTPSPSDPVQADPAESSCSLTHVTRQNVTHAPWSAP